MFELTIIATALLAMVANPEAPAGQKPAEMAVKQKQSVAFDQAEAAWGACVRRETQNSPADQRTSLQIAQRIHSVCPGERELVKNIIRQFVLQTGATPIDLHVSSALSDRIYVLSSAISAEMTSLPATTPSIRVMKGSVNKGLRAYNLGDYETALARWLPKARAGDPDAQNNMGILFEHGFSTHTPKDDVKAADWYLLSARQGQVMAMENLARVYARLGHIQFGESWLNMASTTRQHQALQQAVNQRQAQQNLNSMGYVLGCAIAGGCVPASPTNRTTTIVYQAPAVTPQNPVRVVQTPPPPNLAIKPAVTCSLSPYFKDIHGNPKVECR